LSCRGPARLVCLRSFPTRRSSDLQDDDLLIQPAGWDAGGFQGAGGLLAQVVAVHGDVEGTDDVLEVAGVAALATSRTSSVPSTRSEEHTSELQSRFDLVCRLLLEK